jgi:hypothetical protein
MGGDEIATGILRPPPIDVPDRRRYVAQSGARPGSRLPAAEWQAGSDSCPMEYANKSAEADLEPLVRLGQQCAGYLPLGH